MSWLLTNSIAALLLPPASLMLLIALGLLLLRRRPRVAKWLLTIGVGALWLLSTPYSADWLLHRLEAHTRPLPSGTAKADAIVILGGDIYFHAPEYAGQDTVGAQTLARLRYGARLHRLTGKPILVSGGRPRGNASAEAEQMRAALGQDFQVPVRWIEAGSNNTAENARNSQVILKAEGIRHIYLVTHAWHMPRAAMSFRQVGFQVTEAPTAFTTSYRTNVLTFLPEADALRNSRLFLHEIMGLLWYQCSPALGYASGE